MISLAKDHPNHHQPCLRILGLGIPLMDIIAQEVDPALLAKYHLLPNDVIRDDEGLRHRALLGELLATSGKSSNRIQKVAGGAVQNSMRVAQWWLGKMRAKTEADGVEVCYQLEPTTPTGSCLCLLTDGGRNRSLVADFGASSAFRLDFLKDHFHLVQQAEIIYVSGFHYAVCPQAAELLAKHVQEFNLGCTEKDSKKGRKRRKYFVFNLSAVYVARQHEARALAEEMVNRGKKEDDDRLNSLEQIAQLIADVRADGENDKLSSASRTVIITQGGEGDILVVKSGSQQEPEVQKFPVVKVDAIVDSNGAGDAFVGGYLAALAMREESEKVRIEAATRAAGQILQVIGCQLPRK
ncbi:hypothetical protein TYRP_006743 [Tyrophagus putrescentiae]|nr:hypothetical protein TYRP_006743 [Tyrophagus putrescentiae]